ncbi:hypothetical protein [Gordonia tangerina]|uniref:Uncharacterized protein n=1 Tax=Gordonia tangerina TaxID=2911060 RepID=A0ABS9DGM6_9ACTN|nr:hypothetical protein [Gordonia tangerina]MCF3938382.1 hypothetical protein [Gordonia tangerina]
MTDITRKPSAADGLRGALGIATDSDEAASSDPIVRAAQLQRKYGSQKPAADPATDPLPLNTDRVTDVVRAALSGDTSVPQTAQTAQLIRDLVGPTPAEGRNE